MRSHQVRLFTQPGALPAGRGLRQTETLTPRQKVRYLEETRVTLDSTEWQVMPQLRHSVRVATCDCNPPGWFCPGLVDRLELTSGALFESRWADVTKTAMSALAIVESLDVIEHVRFRFISRQVVCAIHSLAFQ